MSKGTTTFVTESKSDTIGTNNTKISKSFNATCTYVWAGSPLVNELQTKTIAVHGAAPNKTAPAT